MTISKGIGRGGKREGAGRPANTRTRLRPRINKPGAARTELAQAAAAEVLPPTSGPPPKRAKQVLQEFMMVWAGMAAAHQPLPLGAVAGPGQQPDQEKFVLYGKLAADCAAILIRFEEPALKAAFVAHTVVPPAGAGASVTKLPMRDPLGAQRIYRELLEGAPPARKVG